MLYTAALLSAAMLLAGCYSTDTDDDLLSTATLISIYPSTVSVGSAAATQNVVVTLAPKSKRNLDWSCSVQSAWVTAVREKVPGESTGTVYEDAVVLAFLENTAYKRQTTLTITASDGTVLEVPVVQKGIYADAYVKAAPESLTFMAENPQPAAVAIDTNMDTFAAVSDSDWCTVVDNGDGTITVTCTEYGDNTADRTAEITVTAGTPDTSEARTVIPVTQLRKDVYCYLYGSGVPKYPTREKWGQMTKLSDRVYVDSVYVKNGRFSVYTTEGDTYHLDGAGNLSAAETDLTVDVAGLRIVTLNLNEKTYSIERITTPNCLPDSEVAKYATSTYTANGRTKVWMRAGLDWNGGENIGGIKLGSRMVSDANNVGGYTSNLSSYETVRVSDYDEVESGGKAQGEVEMSAKYGRIYTLTEFLTGTPKAAVELARLLTDWPARVPSRQYVRRCRRQRYPREQREVACLCRFREYAESFDADSGHLSLRLACSQRAGLLRHALRRGRSQGRDAESAQRHDRKVERARCAAFGRRVECGADAPRGRRCVRIRLLPAGPPAVQVRVSVLCFPRRDVHLPSGRFEQRRLPVLAYQCADQQCRGPDRQHHL